MKMTIKNIVNITLPVSVLIALLCCSEQPTDPPENGTVEPAAMLTVSDSGLTRLGLRLQLQNARLPALAALTRANVKDTLNDTLLFRHVLTGNDTAFYDDKLQPNESYRYELWLAKDSTQQQWYRFAFNRGTMDTTSHNFSWQVYEFGGAGGSSYLNDVAIVNENNIWAVGRISVADSAGEFENYNAVHWDGEKWELVNIETQFRGSTTSPPLQGVFSFAEDDIWATAGIPRHWDGEKWTLYHLYDMGVLNDSDGGVNRIWGASSDDVYFVGYGGTIVHYDGQSWTKLESGTDVNLTDVWGTPDGSTVWACGWTSGTPYSVLLTIKGNMVELVTLIDVTQPVDNKDELQGRLTSGIHLRDGSYLASNQGVYLLQGQNTSKRLFDRLRYFPKHIYGKDVNDLWVCGDLSMLWHYNGSTAKYMEHGFEIQFEAVQHHNNTVCVVGYSRDFLSKASIALSIN